MSTAVFGKKKKLSFYTNVFILFHFQDLRKQVAPLLKSFQGEVSELFRKVILIISIHAAKWIF